MSKLSRIINEEYAKLVERANMNELSPEIRYRDYPAQSPEEVRAKELPRAKSVKKTGSPVITYRDYPAQSPEEASVNELSPELKTRYLKAPGGGQDRLYHALKKAQTTHPSSGGEYGKMGVNPEFISAADKLKRAGRNVQRAEKSTTTPENIQNLVDLVNEEYANIKNAKIAIIAESIRNLVREEFEVMLKEVEPNREKIAEKLEELRKRLIKDGAITPYIRGQALREYGQRPEARIPVATVAELIQFPISEVTLYFLNGHRIHEGQPNIEYHMGAVRFYGEAAGAVVEK